MPRHPTIRAALIACAAINALAAYLLLGAPAPADVMFGMPERHTIHLLSAFAGYIAGVSTVLSLCLVLQSRIDWPLLSVAALGNACVFGFSVLCWLAGGSPSLGLALGVIDLLLMAPFIYWSRNVPGDTFESPGEVPPRAAPPDRRSFLDRGSDRIRLNHPRVMGWAAPSGPPIATVPWISPDRWRPGASGSTVTTSRPARRSAA